MPSQTRAEKHGIEKGPLADYLNKLTDTNGNSMEDWFKKTYADEELEFFAKFLKVVDKKTKKDKQKGKEINNEYMEADLSKAFTDHNGKREIHVMNGELTVAPE